jgi:hypothetical protein
MEKLVNGRLKIRDRKALREGSQVFFELSEFS